MRGMGRLFGLTFTRVLAAYVKVFFIAQWSDLRSVLLDKRSVVRAPVTALLTLPFFLLRNASGHS